MAMPCERVRGPCTLRAAIRDLRQVHINLTLMTSSQQTPALFKPIKVGRLALQHRVVLAPLTRFRVHASHVPGPQQASYYSQRGSEPGTLLIAEATLNSHDAGGYSHVPGIYTEEQIKAWKKVTDAVHAKGSIFLQLWSLGRVADVDFLENQDPPSPYVSASSVTLTGRPRPPRPLTEAEIQDYIAAYATAASNGIHSAGFDGVEIHGANGYLPDQFLQTTSNTRTDKWGGDEKGRTQLTREIIDAVVDAVGDDRVGLRISSWSTYQGEDPCGFKKRSLPVNSITFSWSCELCRCELLMVSL
ncbi:FMN-linked oxidoreductase [Boletus edulis]|nr:FMN-linked oxidoreductase [Boletus edulis]